VAFCGNGGSASQAQHFAAELVGRFRRERRAFRAIALTTDSSILTAVGNDFCFEEVFSRQVEALLSEGDVLVGLSTSGNSRNVCRAFEIGRKLGLKLIAFTGGDGGRLASLADIELRVTASDAARIQEAHLFLGHLLCDVVEINLNQKRGS
jgi:D-sedoheptulose 7-phosphate isomerase